MKGSKVSLEFRSGKRIYGTVMTDVYTGTPKSTGNGIPCVTINYEDDERNTYVVNDVPINRLEFVYYDYTTTLQSEDYK